MMITSNNGFVLPRDEGILSMNTEQNRDPWPALMSIHVPVF